MISPRSNLWGLRLHLEIEAGRLAYRDRNAFICDTRHAAFPVNEILSKDYAARLRNEIRRDRVADHLPPPLMRKSDTVYLTVVDRDRNCVSFINSVYWGFGSTQSLADLWHHASKSRHGFFARSCSPQCDRTGQAPPPHDHARARLEGWSAIPLLWGHGGRLSTFRTYARIDRYRGLRTRSQEAIDQPRVFYSLGDTQVERGVPIGTVEGLRKLGHRLVEATEPLGGGQMIKIDWSEGVLIGGSDARMDGCALGY